MEAKPPGISITLPVGLIRWPGLLYLAREAKLHSHQFNLPDKIAKAACPTYILLCEWSLHFQSIANHSMYTPLRDTYHDWLEDLPPKLVPL